MKAAFGARFEVLQAPDEFGSGFRGVLRLPEGSKIVAEVLSNMKRTYHFVTPVGRVTCRLRDGTRVLVPVTPGLLKHPEVPELRRLLRDPVVVRKYTVEALRRAPWPVLREFPRAWLLRCMRRAPLTPGRRRALKFLLS